MDFSTLGKGILILGVFLVVVGGLMWLLGRTGLPLGRLPGDIHIQSEGQGQRPAVSCYVPIVSMILLSLVLTVILNIVIRLLNR
jgi:hypothetical protein